MAFIIQECESCNGTGLYQGFAEAKGEAVICLVCRGSGKYKRGYTPFTARKKKRGVKVIRESRGTFVATGVGPIGPSMTYKEFEEKYS